MVTIPTYLQDTQRAAQTHASTLRRVFSFPVLLGSVLVAGSYSIAKNCLLEPDMWWHVAVGQRILATHSWPWSDTYSATVSGTPWIAYEWLGEVVMGAAASVAGLRSATLLLVVLSALLVVLLYFYAILRSGSSKAAFVACATLMPALGAFFGLRPQLIGMIFLVLTLIILEKFREGHERALWLLPPIFLLWVNTHGSFVFGFFVLGVTWLCGQTQFSAGGIFAQRWNERQSVQLLLSILLSALMLPITPYGTRIAAYPLSMAFGQPVNVNNIQEWQPLGTGTILGKTFMIVAILFFLACLIERPKFRLPEIALALFGVFAACTHLRFTLLFVIFFAPLWAKIFARWMPDETKEDQPWFNAGLMAVILLCFVALFPSNETIGRNVESEYPQGALHYLESHPIQGQLFNDYGWGGYLIETNQPKNMIFIDSRVDIYEFAGVFSDYLSIMRLEPDIFKLLKKYNIEACLIKDNTPLATALGAMPGWERVYHDHASALYVRKPLTNVPALEAAALSNR
ncbi:MAG TPA: hypothetical protein VK709_10280 [Candidatus Saccharimonadales bacterium]|jgi:hypothetical protein|nr:hypothetical protein [Candidatus Saccharimonadales bacterium]